MAFDCWFFGNLFRTLVVLCTQQRWPRVPGAAHGDRTDAGHDLALGQMPMAHQPLAAIIGELVGVAAEQGRDFGFNGLCQQHAGTVGKTSVSESAKLPGWESRKTLVSVTAYHSLYGSVDVKLCTSMPYPFVLEDLAIHLQAGGATTAAPQ